MSLLFLDQTKSFRMSRTDRESILYISGRATGGELVSQGEKQDMRYWTMNVSNVSFCLSFRSARADTSIHGSHLIIPFASHCSTVVRVRCGCQRRVSSLAAVCLLYSSDAAPITWSAAAVSLWRPPRSLKGISIKSCLLSLVSPLSLNATHVFFEFSRCACLGPFKQATLFSYFSLTSPPVSARRQS
nr:hypothetical protein CFP56_69337 [Quercus suber]